MCRTEGDQHVVGRECAAIGWSNPYDIGVLIADLHRIPAPGNTCCDVALDDELLVVVAGEGAYLAAGDTRLNQRNGTIERGTVRLSRVITVCKHREPNRVAHFG